MLTLLVISISLSNIMTLNLIGNYRIYGFQGFIFWADLLCLVASYILLILLDYHHLESDSFLLTDFTLRGEGGSPTHVE